MESLGDTLKELYGVGGSSSEREKASSAQVSRTAPSTAGGLSWSGGQSSLTHEPYTGLPHCEVCGGVRWLRVDVPLGHPFFGQAFPCACLAQAFDASRGERLARIAAIPERYKTAGFSILATEKRPQVRRAIVAAKAMGDGNATFRWLVLAGSPGWGKDYLACAALNTRMKRGLWGHYVNVTDFLDRLRDAYKAETYAAVMDDYRRSPLLVLADLGREHRKDDSISNWVAEKLYQLLDYRSREMLETIVTTNRSMEQLMDQDLELADRLADTETGFSYLCDITDVESRRSGWSFFGRGT